MEWRRLESAFTVLLAVLRAATRHVMKGQAVRELTPFLGGMVEDPA
jgi:hypothetical protein